MPRVVPSQVVAFINTLWPTDDEKRNLSSVQAGHLSGLVDLADQIPGELLTMNSAAYARFICAKAHIRHRLSAWASEPRVPSHLGHLNMLGQPEQIPVTLMRDALAKCPDESPAPGISELDFITDPDLKTNLRNDIGIINLALSNGEWKAATVLAGSTIEALLLWDLTNRHVAAVPAAIATLVGNKTLKKAPPANPEDWVLHHYVEVAALVGIIKPETATEARLAKDFRNLIHPGRAQRLGQKCDRGTALASVAALEHVVRDLSQRNMPKYKVGDHLLVKLSGGRIVEVTVKAVVDTSDGLSSSGVVRERNGPDLFVADRR